MTRKILHTTFFIFLSYFAIGQGLQTFDELLQYNFTSSDSLQIQILDAEKDYILKDKGLRINSSAGTNEFGNLERGNIFRVKAGLEWNILDEGYMDRKVSSQLLDVKKKIKEFELDEESFRNNYAFVYNHIIYSFNAEKIRFIKEKSYLIDILGKRYEALYHNHAAEYEDLLSIYDKSDELKILLLSLTNFNHHFEETTGRKAPTLNPQYLPVLDINIDDILSFQIPDTTFAKLQELNLAKNELESKLDRQKRLAIFNNTYWRPLQDVGSDRYLFNSVGIRFSTGLAQRKEERAHLNELRNQVDIQKNKEKNFNQQKELSNHLLEYHAKLRLYSRFLYKLRKLQENKRVDRVVRMVNYKDPQSDLQELNIDLEQLSVEYELLEIKQQLYLYLLKIYFKSNVPSIIPFVKERNFLDVRKKLRGERIAVLSSAYEVQNYNFLAEYLKKNEMSNLIFKGNISQNRDFIKVLGEAGIKVFTGYEAFSHREIVEVPMEQFNSRIELEYWIRDNEENFKNALYEISDINKLLQIDSVVLQDK